MEIKQPPTRLAASRRATRKLGDMLVQAGIIDEAELQAALERQQQTGGFLGETIAALGYADPSQLGPLLEQATGFPFVDLSAADIDFGIARAIPEAVARRRQALPFQDDGDEIRVAFVDPLNIAATDEIAGRIGKRVVSCLAFSADLHDAISRVFDARHKAQAVLAEIRGEAGQQDLTEEDLVGLASDAPIVRLVNGIIEGAISSGASDIHIEPHEDLVKVRIRVDGLLYDQMTIPRVNHAAAISRIKIIASMNIAERRRPQDGRVSFRDDGGREFDLRVSSMPTVFGEKIVMRILEKNNSYASIEKLGFFPEQRTVFERFIKRPHGIVLVTGPTGSGKSTTLFAALQKIQTPTLNINTIEDPVEYHLPGVNQVSVNPKIGVTFASGLRTLVRQDPDVIMVGEIRDAETAEIAIQAALTGHLVLSTLHTNDAPGALVRLQNMGVEPFLISSAVIGVIGQRLLRTVCPTCKEWQPASEEVVAAFGLQASEDGPLRVARGKGCTKCGQRGMRGRSAAFEVMPMSEPIRSMVLQRASGTELMSQARAEGMSTMRESGIRKVLEGATSPEEVMRVLYTEDAE